MRRITSTLPTLAVLAAAASAACAQDAPPEPAKDGAPAPGQPAAKRDEGKFEKTKSGLEWQVIVPGTGKVSPRTGDLVKVNYKGWREDGFVFDESVRHGGPATFVVGQLVPGWNEALQMMTAGAKWKLRLPPALGYGAKSPGADIPANATLLFELELVEVTAMPVFEKPVAENQKTTETGLKYEILKAGEGDSPTVNDPIELKFAFFNAQGKLLDCSERSGLVKARAMDMKLPFLKEAPLLMKPGTRLRFEVPGALGFGPQARGEDLPPNSTTIWVLELVRVIKPLPVPPFEAPDETKFQKSASGLLWQKVKDGEGETPKGSDTVRVHYAGWQTDGELFDSSFARGEPAEFPVGGVIPGWSEGLKMMKPGAVYRFVIPAKLAYGERGAGDKIKPNATLVFYVQLISIVK